VSWHAVDAAGLDLATGRPPRGAGWPTPATAVAAAPVATWPVAAAGQDGRTLDLAAALGPGGERVEALLEALAGRHAPEAGPAPDSGPVRAGEGVDVEALARATPAGPVAHPLAVVDLAAGVEAAERVDRAWLAAVERRRSAPRRALAAAGRGAETEAAVHLALLMGTERLDPADDADVDAHVASGAQLWLLAGAVVSALSGAEPDPFAPWARLVAAGLWPVGPSGGRLVVSAPTGTSAPA